MLPNSSAPYTVGSETSKQAAIDIAEFMHALQKRVYDNIIKSGELGITDDAAEEALDMKHTTYTARRGELVKMGLVKDSGNRGTTRSGKKAVRWCAIDPGNEIALIAQAKEAERERLKSAPKNLVKPSQIPLVGKDVDVTLRAVQQRMIERLKTGDEIKCPCCATLLRGG
tara:strand:- start:2496 stop:3005 length:510 start_codon:yes stop_codon:yes gene_type:complete